MKKINVKENTFWTKEHKDDSDVYRYYMIDPYTKNKTELVVFCDNEANRLSRHYAYVSDFMNVEFAETECDTSDVNNAMQELSNIVFDFVYDKVCEWQYIENLVRN